MGKLRRGVARLIDSYAEGLIDKAEFEPRVTRLRERLRHLEEQLERLKQEAEGEEELRTILGRLETFVAKVKEGLHDADFQTRREIIRALVKRVEIDEQHIRVVFRISPLAPASPFDAASPNLQDWGRRVWKPVFNLLEGSFAVLVVNAQHIKAVPGRKTDVKDAEWIADLLQHGLLKASTGKLLVCRRADGRQWPRGRPLDE